MTLAVSIAVGVGFFLAIMVCVALHEVGHLVPAKLFGVKVPQYFVGFGPTLWSRLRGETRYGLRAFPLGGFVQLLGMYPPRRPGARDTRWQRFADSARAAEWEDIKPSDAGRLFYERSTPKKLLMMSGGIVMNLLLAFALFLGVDAVHGVYRAQPVLATVAPCLPAAGASACTDADPKTPAAEAGLQAGDRVLEFNGTPIASYAQLSGLIRANLDGEARLVVERAGQRLALPAVHTRIGSVADPAHPGRTVSAGWLGVGPVVERTHGGPLVVASEMRDLTMQSVSALVQLPVKTAGVVADLVAGRPRDVNGPVSVVGASTAAGQVAASTELGLGDKVASYASLLASINLFLAIFNLVPLPPLDGGHLAGALYEGARRQFARWRGRPDPGPVDTAKMLPVAYVVGGALLVMGVILIVADIVSPVKIF